MVKRMVKSHDTLIARASPPLHGEVLLAGDKSLSHRAFMFAALALGESVIANALMSDDIKATIACLRALGVSIKKDGEHFHVGGRGGVDLIEPAQPLYCGNSGTSARLLCGILAGHAVRAQVTGDESLNGRPMQRVIAPLRAMGARIECRDNYLLPLTIGGMNPLLPIEWTSEVASAQVKSAILLAGLNALGTTSITEPVLSRDHSEHMLPLFGVQLTRSFAKDGSHTVTLKAPQTLRAPDDILTIPSDPSSAALLAAGALLTGGSLSFPHLLVNEQRIGFFHATQKMGARVSYHDERHSCGEKVANVQVAYDAPLNAITLEADHAAALIDEYPALAIIAAVAHGTSHFKGLDELRHKESNRLEGLCERLVQCGVKARTQKDALIIEGSGGKPIAGGVTIAAAHDHRIAMAFALLGLASARSIRVTDCATIASSFPNFTDALIACGALIDAS